MSVKAVSKIGRIRLRVPIRIRSLISVTPSSLSSLNPLIKTNPFKTATPKSTMKPTPAEILKGISLKINENMPPIIANGMAT